MSAIVFIPLTRGKVAVIDFEDFEKVRPYKWHADKNGHRWYATRGVRLSGKLQKIYMHRFLLKAPVGTLTDHDDGNGLNNRRYNICVCSEAENQHSFRTKSKNASSKFRGVSWLPALSRWRAGIEKSGKYFNLGNFESEEAAARAYDKKALELFGKFASPNFSK